MAFDLALSMEESMGTGEVLQSGNLIVEDNQPAKIVAGQSEFFRVVGADGAAELKEIKYNLDMSVTPHITADGAVQMKITITSDTPRPSPGGDAVTSRNNRSLDTTLLRRNGETAVIGGIYNTTYNKSKSGVPYLSSIPIIGALFRSSEEAAEKRELLVMVTPTIINGGKAQAGASSGDFSNGVNAVNAAPQNAAGNVQITNAGSGNNSNQPSFSNGNFGNSNPTNNGAEGQSQNQQGTNQQGFDNEAPANQNQEANQEADLGQNQGE